MYEEVLPTRYCAGDVVQVNAGGPLMTVYEERADGAIECWWFDDANVLHKAHFDSSMLFHTEADR